MRKPKSMFIAGFWFAFHPKCTLLGLIIAIYRAYTKNKGSKRYGSAMSCALENTKLFWNWLNLVNETKFGYFVLDFICPHRYFSIANGDYLISDTT